MLQSIKNFYKYSTFYNSKEIPIESKDEYAFIKDSTHILILIQAKNKLNDSNLLSGIMKENENIVFLK